MCGAEYSRYIVTYKRGETGREDALYFQRGPGKPLHCLSETKLIEADLLSRDCTVFIGATANQSLVELTVGG